MPVQSEHRGTGSCPAPESKERLGFEECNTHSCMTMLPSNRSTLECRSFIDVVIMMDGSGSLGEYAFNQSKIQMSKILNAMVGGEDKVNVAFLMFGGPRTEPELEKCIGEGGASGELFDAAKDCGMHWVDHFTYDTSAVGERVSQLSYPQSTTMTSMALAEAKTELSSGRQEADSVVIVITDGRPMSARRTATAAVALKKEARVIWVPIGPTLAKDMELIKTWATKPWEDNVIPISKLNDIATPRSINSIISSACPIVG